MTAFHIALCGAYAKIVSHFFESYPPKEGEYENIYRSPESKSNLRLALDTREPEMVWLVLDKKVYTDEERDAAWGIVKDKKFKSSISPADKYIEFVNLFGTYGGHSLHKLVPEPESSPIVEFATFSMHTNNLNGPQQNGKRRPLPPAVQTDSGRSHTASPIPENVQTPVSATPASSPRGYRGQHNPRGSFRPHQQFQKQRPASSSPVDQSAYRQDGTLGQQQHDDYRGRGRGRGQYRGRDRGRGRGEPPVHAASAAA